jgi:dihydrofolate synthase / folylpolyglutamate synthase
MNTTPIDPTESRLDAWLRYAEGLHTRGIDMGLDRLREVSTRMPVALGFDCPVITVAGTNGKGSTCAMLEAILLACGYRVGVYSSPHLIDFEERCRIGGVPVKAPALVQAFQEVERVRAGEGQATAVALTYFEFTTLGILRLFQQAKLDVVILEVGLGGRLDAVNLIDTDCAIITSIDVDHVEYLGHDREVIGLEKAGIMRAGKPAIVSDPMPPASVAAHALAVGADLWQHGQDFNVTGDKQQWAWAGRGKRWAGLAHPGLRGANQLINAAGVLAALQALRPLLPVTAQGLRQGLAVVELPGRFQIKPGQPVVVFDVAHNPHSVAALTVNLDAMGFYPRTHVVLGAMADKDLGAMLQRISPLVDAWYCCDLPLARAAKAVDLERVAKALDAQSRQSFACYEGPAQALAAARAAADPADRIVVFGSFYTVGGALQSEAAPARPNPSR